MTFTEAAVEVLRLVGKPLHYKKITEVAIERNLLSHVGKTPEVTMSSRLATMVKRDRGEAPVLKVKPGVFGLREFSEEQLADLSGDVDELPEVEVVENEQAKPEEAGAADGNEVDVKLTVPVQPRRPLPGADVFPEEEDDDDPILGGDDDDGEDDDDDAESANGGEAEQTSESRSQRRRRKRRRRGGEEAAEEPRAREVGTRDEPREAAREPREAAREPREAARESREAAREPREARNGRSERRDRRDERRPGGREERRDVRDERRDRDERRPERRDELVLDMSREPADGDLLGKELSDAVASVLSQSGPRGLSALRVADLLVRKGRLQGDPSALLPTVMAAVRADVARRRHEPRPRFRVEGANLVLTEFLLPQDVVRAEQDVMRAAERQRDRARRAFLRKLSELPGAGLAEIIATWLNAEGVVGLRAVRRPSAPPGELHLAGTLRRGPEEVRLAVVITRDARELGREKVIEARGALHYYGGATTAWLVTMGSVMSGAREEASAPATAPVALYDGLALASAMERAGVGLGVQQVAISCLDFELLDALRGPSALRERERERDQEPDRDRNRGRERDRDRGRERGERERPRLVLERPMAVAQEPTERDEVEPPEEEEEVAEPAEEEASELLEEETPTADGDESAQAQGESREGTRRRRRRRRRRGRPEDASEALAAGAEPLALAVDESEEDLEPGDEAAADEGTDEGAMDAAPSEEDDVVDGYEDEEASAATIDGVEEDEATLPEAMAEGAEPEEDEPSPLREDERD